MSESPPDVFTNGEREVLKNCTVRRKYFDLAKAGRKAEAKHFLAFEVNILQIHEANSRKGNAAGCVLPVCSLVMINLHVSSNLPTKPVAHYKMTSLNQGVVD